MLKDSETIGAGTVTLQNDFRVLPFGKVLRKTKINELPQLFNILIGDMSVIGPRPLHNKQFNLYSADMQRKISSVLPGLSGVGSIIFRDEEAVLGGSADPLETYRLKITPVKAELESWYVENRSLWLYFKLIALTIVAVCLPKADLSPFVSTKV